MKAYAKLSGAKGDSSGMQRFYRITFKPEDLDQVGGGWSWRGPYRDKTDAENAAEDEAKDRGLELEWVE